MSLACRSLGATSNQRTIHSFDNSPHGEFFVDGAIMFGNKEFGKHVGYPTPESTPEDSTCLMLQIPANPAWWAIYAGLLLTLTDEDAWQQFEGGMSREDAAAEAAEIYQDAMDRANTDECSINIGAPYWDDENGDDADDEQPVDEQDWYGFWDGETFLESVAYWAVTAFLATGVSEGAAIEFITPLRKFRLLLKSNPHGAKLLVLMDSNIFQLIDTFSSSDDVISVDIVSPGSTLTIVHTGEHNPSATPDANGNYVIDVIRKRLWEAEVTPPNQRVDPDTNIFQITVDGGTTWNSAEGSDPRTNDAYKLQPLEPYTGIECDVAARLTAQLKDTLDIFIASGDAAQSVTGWLALLLLPFGLVGWFIDVLLAIANVLIDIGQANIEAAFTEGVWDDIKCSFFCRVDDVGQISQADLDSAYDEIVANHAGVVANVINELRLFFGDVAMSNAGVVRDETDTCDDCLCGWERCVDFTTVCPSDFSLVYGDCDGTNGITGEFLDSNSQSVAYAEISLGAVYQFTRIEFQYSGSFSGANGAAKVQGYLSGSQVFQVVVTTDGSHLICAWEDTPTDIDYFNIQINSGTDGGPDRLESCIIRGVGTAPAILEDCP